MSEPLERDDPDDLDDFGDASADDGQEVVEARLRLPRSVVRHFKLLAAARGMSMKALAAGFIDKGLQDNGRPGIDALSPGFRTYLKSKGGRQSRS